MCNCACGARVQCAEHFGIRSGWRLSSLRPSLLARFDTEISRKRMIPKQHGRITAARACLVIRKSVGLRFLLNFGRCEMYTFTMLSRRTVTADSALSGPGAGAGGRGRTYRSQVDDFAPPSARSSSLACAGFFLPFPRLPSFPSSLSGSHQHRPP